MTAIETNLPFWKIAWRAFAQCLPSKGLRALKKALERDDPELLQGATTSPPPLQCVQDWPVEAACAVTYCGWKGEGLATVAEAQEAFATACFEADRILNEPNGCRWFLNWFDETPRQKVRRLLLAEVELSLENCEEVDDGPT